ncbi:HlyD family efflux transporter periplasmic adaptor subunit [Patescibacteria group bacterium]|nr:HlyD family efflux transporter periplasmic adaptor subunit [Patescibacteria group bacterium]MCL5091296.1 HlyD family efflux transporter periplasmic adaptor subunit [Patescibacteria group bacterium]
MKNILNRLKQPLVQRTVGGIMLVILLIAAAWFYATHEGRVKIDNSLVEAPIVSISPQTVGKLAAVNVSVGQPVKKGDIVATVGSEYLRAYTDGLIVEASGELGAMVSAQTPPVKMIDPAQMRISGTIDENKGLNQIKIGQVAAFTVDALPGKIFWGYVDEIAATAKQTQLTFSISSERPTQQFVVYVRFPARAYPQIKNGMSAKLTVYTNTP